MAAVDPPAEDPYAAAWLVLAPRIALAAGHAWSDAFGATEVALCAAPPPESAVLTEAGATAQAPAAGSPETVLSAELHLGRRPAGWLRARAQGTGGTPDAAALRLLLEAVAEVLGESAGEPATLGAPAGDELLGSSTATFRFSGGAGEGRLWLSVAGELLEAASGPAAAAWSALSAGVGQPVASWGAAAAPTAFPVLGGDPSGSMSPLYDVPLEITVELGRAERQVRDVLALVPGSIVALDRLAGDPVDVLVNGRRIARGEVVVVDDSFGVRITEIPGADEPLEPPV